MAIDVHVAAETFGRMWEYMNRLDDELAHQVEKWGVQGHSQANWYAILGEEFGEVGKAICEIALGARGSYTTANLSEELIHTAAVAIAMAESLDRAGFYGIGKDDGTDS